MRAAAGAYIACRPAAYVGGVKLQPATQRYKYDVAFSFLARDEATALAINDRLQDRLETFIYSKRQEIVGGTDGELRFNAVFGQEARLVVVLYRTGWGETPWTRIEETAIRNRAYDEGYEFAKFIPLESPPTVPKYFPRTQIWLGLERFGLDGAASVIEARVQELGGEPHEETVAERAARLERAHELSLKREQFRASTDGVNRARDAATSLIREIEVRVQEISSPQLPIKTKKRRSYLVLTGVTPSLSVEWHGPYTNTLDDSRLIVSTWSWNHPPFPGIILLEEPKRRSTETFTINLSGAQELIWVDKEGHEYGSSALSSIILKRYMDHIEEYVAKRANR